MTTTGTALATRCTACATAFRVVQDQLKVSEGWVRCGRCDAVFNALEQLFDLRDEPLPPDAAGHAGEPLSHASLPELPADDAPKPPLADAFSALLRSRSAAPPAAEHADGVRPGTTAAFTAWPPVPSSQPAMPDFGAAFDNRAGADHRRAQVDVLLDGPGGDAASGGVAGDGDAANGGLAPAVAAPHAAADAAVAADPAAAAAAAGAPTPEFIRAAERDARWRRPPVRRALVAASAVLLVALVLQVAHQFRDALAARWPAARPLLDGWCDAVGCRIGPLRRIGDLTVENTALAPVGSAPGTFQLSVTLRNRGPLAVALPAVDLSLTDSNGQLVARRALAAADFRPAAELLGPDTDTRLQALLETEPRVVGYTVDLFYP